MIVGEPTGTGRLRPATACPGPAPTFLFAPGHVTKRSAEWGAAGLEARIATAWQAYADGSATGWN